MACDVRCDEEMGAVNAEEMSMFVLLDSYAVSVMSLSIADACMSLRIPPWL